MPFSVIAVLLLVLSGSSIALMYHVSETEDRLPLEMAREMARVADRVASDLEEVAYSKAIDSVLMPSNLSEGDLRERFESLFSEYIVSHFPKGTGIFTVEIEGNNASMIFMRANIDELYPELEGIVLDCNSTTVPVYFSIAGNLTVLVRGEAGLVLRIHELDRSLYLPVPLLVDRVESLANAFEGGRCEFENIVRYELSALVQDRVLRGYGMGSTDGHMGTADILTESDVIRAVNLALLLETRGKLRQADPSLMSHMEGIWKGPWSELLSSYVGGDLDPADLFLSSYGIEEYDPGLLLSQSLYAITDVLVLGWLEFLNLLDLGRGMESIIDDGSIALNEMIDRCLGVDLIQDGMSSWISESMSLSGYQECDYRYLHHLPQDGLVEVPVHTLAVINEMNQTFEMEFGGTYPVDFPSLDLLDCDAWGGFQEDWRRSTFQLGESMQTFVKQIATGISSGLPWDGLGLDVDPRDGSGFLDTMVQCLERLSTDPLIRSNIEDEMSSTRILDPMTDSFHLFLDENWDEIVNRESTIRSSCYQIADRMVQEASEEIPHMGNWSRSMLRSQLYTYFTDSSTWNLIVPLEWEFDRTASWRLEAMRQAFSEGDFGQMGLLVDAVSGLVSGVPGIWDGLSEYIARQVREIRDCFELRCDEIRIPVPDDPSFEIDLGDSLLHETMGVQTGIISLADGGEQGGLDVDITLPWEHDGAGDNPNTHRTNPGNLSLVPYTTQWTVSLSGDIHLMVCADGMAGPIAGEEMPVERVMEISTEFTLVVNSGWSLAGVDYTPTSTMLGEIVDFMEGIWDGIVDSLKVVADGITGAFSFFKNMLSSLLSYSMKALEYLSQGLQVMVEGLQGILGGAAGKALGLIGGFVESIIGTVTFNTTIFGMLFSVETNAVDIALGVTKDILKVTFSFSVMGTAISISNRLVRLGAGDYDLLVNCTLGEGDWSLSIIVDPLMKLFNHFVEIKGLFQGTVLVIYLPEVVEYSTLKVSLADIPGLGTFLSSIPTPIPGVKASIDAGFEVRFTSPFVNHPVINEYEQNPPGVDSGNEWIEIYNPTDEAISLEGWSVGTSHGDQRLDRLSGISIMPRERIVYTFQGQALDNGGAAKFPLCECVVLKDMDGNRVDSTPWTKDHFNDGRTWQRSYDGSDRWVFKEATRGTSNGKRAVMSSEIQFIEGAIWDSIARAFGEAGKMDPSLESLSAIFNRATDLIRERCIDMMASIIVEIRLFVEVSLNDYSGAVGAGFSLSLVITGECVRETLGMISEMVITAFTHITNPLGAATEVRSMEKLAEHIFIRFTTFGRAGLPRMASGIVDSPEFRLEVVMGVNLACLATACGYDFGRPAIEFGVALTGLPGGMLPGLFGVDADRTVDLWLIKATLFPA